MMQDYILIFKNPINTEKYVLSLRWLDRPLICLQIFTAAAAKFMSCKLQDTPEWANALIANSLP